MNTIGLFLSAVIGYLFGSFSTGLLMAGLAKVDIRKLGSKSTGATNVTRVMGFKNGLITFLGDILKAALAILIAWQIAGTNGGLIAGLFAVIGHNWPIYYSFQGGKGVACSVAVLVLNAPLEGAVACVVAVIVIAVTRYVSLGSLTLLLTAAVLLPFTRAFWPWGVWALALLILAAWRHKANIQRLLNGTENKFTGRKQVS